MERGGCDSRALQPHRRGAATHFVPQPLQYFQLCLSSQCLVFWVLGASIDGLRSPEDTTRRSRKDSCEWAIFAAAILCGVRD